MGLQLPIPRIRSMVIIFKSCFYSLSSNIHFFPPLVLHSPCLRTTITMRTASFLKRTLRKLLPASPFLSVSWTKTSECSTGHALICNCRREQSGICSDKCGDRKLQEAAQLTITSLLSSLFFACGPTYVRCSPTTQNHAIPSKNCQCKCRGLLH